MNFSLYRSIFFQLNRRRVVLSQYTTYIPNTRPYLLAFIKHAMSRQVALSTNNILYIKHVILHLLCDMQSQSTLVSPPLFPSLSLCLRHGPFSAAFVLHLTLSFHSLMAIFNFASETKISNRHPFIRIISNIIPQQTHVHIQHFPLLKQIKAEAVHV